jgi:hypothetical protein
MRDRLVAIMGVPPALSTSNGLRAERDSLPRSERGVRGVWRNTPLLEEQSEQCR